MYIVQHVTTKDSNRDRHTHRHAFRQTRYYHAFIYNTIRKRNNRHCQTRGYEEPYAPLVPGKR